MMYYPFPLSTLLYSHVLPLQLSLHYKIKSFWPLEDHRLQFNHSIGHNSQVLNPLAFFLPFQSHIKMSYYHFCGLRRLQFFKSWPTVYNGGLKFEHVINHCENFTTPSILVKTLEQRLKKTLNTIWAHHQPHAHCCSSSTLSAASFSVTGYHQPIYFTKNPKILIFFTH